LADPTRIQQLVMNLVVNARDAMPVGGKLFIELAIRIFGPDAKPPLPDMHSGEWVQLIVRDTGAGIAPEHLEHVFEPFFTTKGPDKGTGLGLAQAHGIVAQHEGFIQVSSQPGAGATFVIWLPVHALAELAIPVRTPPPTLPHGQAQTVLIVEDDAVLRTSLVELLNMLNYQVVEAGNGEEALQRLFTLGAAVDLILSDVVMPKLGGAALVKSLREMGVQTPVILMSGHPKGEEPAALDALDIYAWLDKPPSSQRLAYTLAAALAR
jgi:CheY-like chemotaxis protein